MKKALTIVLFATCLVPLLMGQSYTIQTIAGSVPDRNGGTVNTLYLLAPEAVTMDRAGNTYIADTGSHKVWKIDSNGLATLVMGSSITGLTTSGAAAKGNVGMPSGLATDAEGNLYIADRDNARVVKVDKAGNLSVAAGYGTGRYTGDGRSAVAAGINGPRGLAFDTAGNFYIADTGNHRIRKVDTAGIITTIAGSASGYTGDDGLAKFARLNAPEDVTVDSAGNVYIADTGNHRIRKIDAVTGNISTIAGSGAYTLANNDEGSVYITQAGTPGAIYTEVLSCSSTGISCFRGDGFQGSAALLYGPAGVKVDNDGVVYIADRGNARIRALDQKTGVIRTVSNPAGSFPSRIWVDQAGGRLLIPDSATTAAASDSVLLVEPSRAFTRLAENARAYSGAKRNSPAGVATQAVLHIPFGLARDTAGNIYFSEVANHRVLKLDSAGNLSVVAGTGVAGNAGDDGLATMAKLNTPKGVAVDGSGNLYIADQQNNRIRMVASNGIITTLATGFNRPVGVAADNAGNIYVADARNHVVQKIAAGTTTPVVFAGTRGTSGAMGDGGLATQAYLNIPQAVAVSPDGKSVYIADSANCTVRVVNNGKILGVAGAATACDFDDVSSSTNAYERRFRASISGLAVDAAGNVYIADTNNSRIRKVDPNFVLSHPVGNGPNGPAQAGVLIAAAGSNSTDNLLNNLASSLNFNGDGAAASTRISQPAGVALDSEGNIYIADQGNGLIRKAVLSK